MPACVPLTTINKTCICTWVTFCVVQQDTEVLRAWLADLHFEEYYNLFVHAGYDMPTISRMTPEVSVALVCSLVTSPCGAVSVP